MNIFNKPSKFLSFSQQKSQYNFLSSGDIYNFKHHDILTNQFRGNLKDGSLNNIYLRIYKDQGIVFFPLMGVQSNSLVEICENALSFVGEVDSISYRVLFRPHNHVWFWTVFLSGSGEKVDLVYGQDLGVAIENAIYTNELYSSQYLGHTVFQENGSYVVCSRQNMQQGETFPYVQQGVIGAKAIHYSTDGLQFFGLSSKETGVPSALSGDLPSVTLQYEFAYIGLQTESFIVCDKSEITFYGISKLDHPQVVTSISFKDEIEVAYAALSFPNKLKPVPPVNVKEQFGTPYSSRKFTENEISQRFPIRKLEETRSEFSVEEGVLPSAHADNELHSFYSEDHIHVVTKAKELITQRPHGSIVITCPDSEKINNHLISSTQYMYGIFGGHIVTGNTDMHKFISTPRGFLNLHHNSGLRLYVCIDGTFQLLNLPGAFEMGMNYSRWYYQIHDDVLCVTGYTAANEADFIFEVISESGLPYNFIVTAQLTMGSNEQTCNIPFEKTSYGLRFPMGNPIYPNLHYDIDFNQTPFTVSDDRIFFESDMGFDETFLTLSTYGASQFTITIQGRMEDCDYQPTSYTFTEEKCRVLAKYRALLQGFHLQGGTKIQGTKEEKRLDILNETAWWYTHNAMIHFSMPHGLEQPGGAAWGTRDVCQGPVEYFLAMQHHVIVREILLNIFSHQNFTTKEWPQWFMFDKYDLNAGECHGDVVFWPLKCVADYLYATGDCGILDEKIPYDDRPEQHDTLLSHISLALSNIQKTRFIDNTGLLTYAGGDWDDTLQPVDESMKEHLISSWTMALAYQTFIYLAAALPSKASELAVTLNKLASQVKHGFETFAIKDHVISGFLEHDNGHFQRLLHPDDKRTGIHYRLLPMTRSIISGLASPDQANLNVDLIQSVLKCPDGVRLMDRPAEYKGGVSHLFKRAEQASNIGREVSLQYVHAHIRYIEAMAKLGNGSEAWEALFQINPILLDETVPNALPRQSNMYFSSSDGNFPDRYQYASEFYRLKEGSIDVKGGWRLYSSGPGIYLNQMIANVFGIRFSNDGLVIDPVLPKELDGAVLAFCCFGRQYQFEFCALGADTVDIKVDGISVPTKPIPNPYRRPAAEIAKNNLPNDGSRLVIYY